MAWIYRGRKYWYHNGKRYSCKKSRSRNNDFFSISESFIKSFYKTKKRKNYYGNLSRAEYNYYNKLINDKNKKVSYNGKYYNMSNKYDREYINNVKSKNYNVKENDFDDLFEFETSDDPFDI